MDFRIVMDYKEIYKPYYEAVKKILNRTPVKELDDIRIKCNEVYLKNSKQMIKGDRDYTSEEITTIFSTQVTSFISFIAEAENKILMGVVSREAYKRIERFGFKKFRKRCRSFLEKTADDCLFRTDKQLSEIFLS